MIPENLILAPYACKSSESRGRVHLEPPSKARTEFQRDHDRIIHSAAFRRLEYKTQVFVNHEGDLFRTRLTHSLEVAQISRSVASRLSLNTDLAEAIALAHDLGHTPFGHAGQEALDECMKDFGGFEHNLQSLRIIDKLEEQYPRFNGLNLTWETREGVLKHCKLEIAKTLGDLGERFLNGHQPSLEAQLVNITDAIAYCTHDIDDGLRQQILHNDGLMEEVPIWKHYFEETYKQYPKIPLRRLQKEIVRRVIGWMVDDLFEESTKNINLANPQSPEEVRALSKPLIAFSPEVHEQIKKLKDYLMNSLYRDYQVQREMHKNAKAVKELFEVFQDNPLLLPPRYQNQIETEGKERTVADYIAGMTDRFALREYERIFEPISGIKH